MRLAAALILLVGGSGVSAGDVIPPISGRFYRAVVADQWIVWAEPRQGALSSIYAYNIDTDQTTSVVADDPSTPDVIEATAVIRGDRPWHPQIAVSDGVVVYSDRRNWSTTRISQLVVHRLDTGVETIIPSIGATRDNQYASIDGDRLVWQYGGWGVLGNQIDGGTLQYLGGGLYPDVTGDVAVWKTGETGAQIRYYNLATRQSGLAFDATDMQTPRQPVIDGDIIAWSMRDLTSGQNIVSIMAYDMSTGQLITAKDDIGSFEHRANVAISNRIIVWEDWRHNPARNTDRIDLDVYGYDVATGREVPIATGPGNQHEPWIDGDIVVWSDDSTGTKQIGWTRLSEMPEPGSIMLMLGAAGAMAMRRKKQ